jgi:hypothetical protein
MSDPIQNRYSMYFMQTYKTPALRPKISFVKWSPFFVTIMSVVSRAWAGQEKNQVT